MDNFQNVKEAIDFISLDTLIFFFSSYGYAAVFLVLFICGFGVPIPEDITLVAGGIISGLGYTNVHIMLFVGLAGVLVGDATMFCTGRLLGDAMFRNKIVAKILTPKRYELVQEKFEKHGNWLMFIARFLPGLRSPIFLTAGASRKVTFAQFILLDGFAALISVPIWVYLGYFGANQREWLMTQIKRGQSGIVFVFVALILGLGIYLFLKSRRRKKA